MSMHEVMQNLAGLARRQHGVFDRAQALAAGASRRMIEYRIGTGEWILLAPNVYALASFPSTWRRQYKAAELSVPMGVVAGLAAAKVHGWDGFNTVRPEVVVEHRCRHRSPIATVHRGTDVKWTTVDRMRVTTPAQTLCDLLARIRLDRWERTADGLLLERRMSIDDLVERRDAYDRSRRPAIALLRTLVDERSASGWVTPESELERLLRQAIGLVAECPPVEWQAAAPWSATGERVDGLIPEWALVVEADGRRWHARVQDFDHDRWRDNRAVAAGFRVLRFTHTHLVHRMDEVAAIIQDAGRTACRAA